MRLVLSAMLAVAGCALATPAGAEPAGAEPYNCPPACNSIPASAWITPSAIPLDDRYNWPEPAGVSVRAPSPRFRFEELCATGPAAADPRGYAVTEQAVVINPPGQWQLQVQVLHWRGETWRGGQLVADTFAAAVEALRNCQLTNAQASPSLTTAEPDRMAAVISGPVIVHQYIVANPSNSTISEVALWSSAPPQIPWPAVSDDAVLNAMSVPLCTAYIGSCP